MLPKYKFKCSSCSFETIADIGCKSSAFRSVRAMVCTECATFETFQLDPKTGRDLASKAMICKLCRTGNHLVAWNGLTCPRCQKTVRAYGPNLNALKRYSDY